MKVTETYISSIFDGNKQPYIYIWVSKRFEIIYVGMTNSRLGTLGRAISHCNINGTLRVRFLNNSGSNLEKADDLKLISFSLPRRGIYYSLERSYREAIEYLVQNELVTKRGNFLPKFDVISWVRTSPRTQNSEVKKLAKQIVDEFSILYPNL